MNFGISRRKSFWLRLAALPAIMASSVIVFAILSIVLFDAPGEIMFAVILMLVAAPVIAGYFYLHYRHYRSVLAILDQGLCPRCEYNLRGSVQANQPRCPECGNAITDAMERRVKYLLMQEESG